MKITLTDKEYDTLHNLISEYRKEHAEGINAMEVSLHSGKVLTGVENWYCSVLELEYVVDTRFEL